MKKNIVLCDIDGTIANNDHRQHFLEGKKDWDGFFSELNNDEPIHEVIEEIKYLYSSGKEIIFITGRPERYRNSSTKWLSRFFNFKIKIIMRNNKDKKNKLQVKKEMFDLHFKSDQIFCIFENDPALIALWSSLDIEVKTP